MARKLVHPDGDAIRAKAAALLINGVFGVIAIDLRNHYACPDWLKSNRFDGSLGQEKRGAFRRSCASSRP